jgi:hypothetical protein
MCPLFFVVLLLVACFTPLRAASTNITYMKSNMEFIETPLPKDYVLPYTLERINSSTKENYSPDCLCLHFFNQALYMYNCELDCEKDGKRKTRGFTRHFFLSPPTLFVTADAFCHR